MERTTATTKKATLYERLGGETGVRKIVNDVLDKHTVNPVLAHHFQNIDMKKLKHLVFDFFSMGTGGPHSYTGRDMRTSHTGMNITEKEWESATEDTLWAMDTNGVAEAEKNEVLTILDSLKGEIVGV